MHPNRTRQFFLIFILCALFFARSPGSLRAGNNLWTAIGPEGGDVNTIIIDPANPTTLYAGAYNGVYKSTDGGASWRASSQGLTNTHIHILVIDPTTPNTLYAGGSYGVFKSTDSGATWQTSHTGMPKARVEALTLDPMNPATLYAGANIVYKSTNAGASWTATATITNTTGIRALAVDPANAATLYAVLYEGLFQSVDGGQNWNQLKNGFPAGTRVYDLAINRTNSQILYAGTSDGIFKSENKGDSWSKVQNGWANALVIDPTDFATIYAGTSDGIFKSNNHGVSWRAINNGLAVRNVIAVAIDPQTPTNLYAGTYGGGIFKSVDRGENWAAANTGLINNWINAMLIDPVTPTTLFVAGSGGLLYKSTTRGLDWNLTNNGSALYIYELASHPLTPTTLYAGTIGGPYKSTDGGANWFSIYSCPILCLVTAFAVDPLTPSTVYWGSAKTSLDSGAVAKSTNAGASWNIGAGLPGTTVNTLAIDPQQPNILYAGTDSGLYKSVDQAEQWTPPNGGLPTEVAVNALAIHPFTPTIVYAGTARGVFKSSDRGANWQEIGLSTGSVIALVIDPLNPANLYAAHYDSIFQSSDNGASWGFFNSGLTTQRLTTLHIDPQTPTLLYAGTQGEGVFAINRIGGPTITLQPTSQTFMLGQSVTLHVAAAGNGTLHYQWYQGSGGDIQTPISGATADTYTTPPLTANARYWVQVSDEAGGRTDSVTALLTLLIPGKPNITQHPASQTISLGQSVSLHVAASGDPPLTYQWYQGNGGDTSQPINGATTPNFTATALSNNSNFWVRVTSGSGVSSDSETAAIIVVTRLGVSAPPTITSGAEFPLIVTALDSNNVLAAGYRGAVSFASSDQLARLPPSYTFTVADNGAHTFFVQMQTIGSQSLTVSDQMAGAVTGAASVEVRSQPLPQQSWTLLIYAVGDNNLAFWMGVLADGMLARLARAGRQPNVQVGVLYDGPGVNDTVRYILDNQQGGWSAFPQPEARMDEMETLRDFMQWGFTTFQSDHYYLAIADHANGVKGIGEDRSSSSTGDAFLEPNEVRQALQQASAGGQRLNVLHFDGCSFGLFENTAIAEGLTDYVIASPNTGWGIFAYDAYHHLAGQTANDPRAFAQAVAQHYATTLTTKGYPYTISVFAMAHYASVRDAIDGLGDSLVIYVKPAEALLLHQLRDEIRRPVQKYDSSGDLRITEQDAYVDLRGLAEQFHGLNEPAISLAANRVLSATVPFVVLERHASSSLYGNLVDLSGAQGLAIYYPYVNGSSAYQKYVHDELFINLTPGWGWREFLALGSPSTGEPPPEERLIPTLVENWLFLPVVQR